MKERIMKGLIDIAIWSLACLLSIFIGAALFEIGRFVFKI